MSLSVSVVIPVRNNPEGIRSCLAGLGRQGMVLDIIVVDDGSKDETASVAKACGARVISSNEPGAAAARNTGALAAKGEVILFTDADCIPCPGWARNLTRAVLEDGVVAAKGAYRTRQQSITGRFVQLEYEERYERMRKHTNIDFLDTYSLAVEREAFLEIGGFDEGFQGASVEDQEMSFRLNELGSFRFIPEAIVLHKHADSPAAYFRKKLRIGRGKATLLRRHPKKIHGDSHTPDSLRYQIGAVILAMPLIALCALSGSFALPAVALSLAPLPLSTGLLRDCVARGGIGFLLGSTTLVVLRAWSLSIGFVWGAVSPTADMSRRQLITESSDVDESESVTKEADVHEVVH